MANIGAPIRRIESVPEPQTTPAPEPVREPAEPVPVSP